MTRSRAVLLPILWAVAACGTDTGYPYWFGDTAGDDVADTAAFDDATDAPDPGDAGDTPVVDTAPDAGGGVGTECSRNTDCASLVCVPVGVGRNVCSESCATEACVAGWRCDEAESVCLCSATIEICDGVDNDCDGLVDEGSGPEIGCAPSQACLDAECRCPGMCGGVCTDTLSDPGNCGECDRECADNESCVDGDCVCSLPSLVCSGLCVDPMTDEANCGRCGRACEAGDACAAGECGCPDTLTGCPDGCVDTTSDRFNCGRCGRLCAGDQTCSAGECVCACPDGACEAGRCRALPYPSGPLAVGVVFSPEPQQADFVLNIDTTGSMGGEVSALRSALASELIPRVEAIFADPAIAVTAFEDFPCGSYGASGDVAFQLRQRVTTSTADARAALDGVTAAGGGDGPEAGFEALFQIATGTGRTECGTIPPFDPDLGRVEGVADGVIGGVGFRDGSLPVIVHITDAQSHARDEAGYPYGATRAQALEALDTVGARFVGIASGSQALADLTAIAASTASTVPPCAWGAEGTRPTGCSAVQCCTAAGGAGRPAESGRCPLVFDISDTGSGIDNSVVAGIRAVARWSPADVRLRVVRDAATFEASGTDTSCLVSGARVLSVEARDACAPDPVPTDTDGDGVRESVENVTSGALVTYEIAFENDCIAVPGVYPVHLELVSGEATRLAVETVYAVVAGD